MTSVNIFKDNNKFYRLLLNMNSQIEFISVPHQTKSDCLKTLHALKKFCTNNKAYRLKRISCGSWLFEFVNINSSETIGESQTYISKAVLNQKIQAFQNDILNAKINSEVYSF